MRNELRQRNNNENTHLEESELTEEQMKQIGAGSVSLLTEELLKSLANRELSTTELIAALQKDGLLGK